ncbi:MAG: hypothetical protein ACTSO9_07615 [Candidatus Helarchaeota archaeon]
MLKKEKQDLWMEIPYSVYVALGRRGQEQINTEQCWLPGCDNKNKEELIPLGKESSKVEIDKDSYYICNKVKIKCNKCGGIFQFAMKTIYTKNPKDIENEEVSGIHKDPEPFMGQLFILDENDNNLGFAGYF